MKNEYIVKLSKPNGWSHEVEYLRVYKNQKDWVTRKHCKTATHFESSADAWNAVKKFQLETKASILFTNNRVNYYLERA